MTEYDYSIGYVSKFTKLPQSVLRYWETVFDVLKPYKTEGGTRKYSEQDLELVQKIKHLLYDRKFTIAGANNYLNSKNEKDDEETITISKNQFLGLLHELEKPRDLFK